jgi:3-oxoacyl-[acyl-carrier protein] reductase
MLLQDKVAFVTGAGRGIGREISLCFAKEGAHVAVCDCDQEAVGNVSGEVQAYGRRSMHFVVDVTRMDQVQDAVNKTIDSFKGIDILVNNAGITRDTFLLRMSDTEWDTVLAVNLKGAFNVTKAVIKPMMKKRAGKIINIASIVGLIGNAGQTNYAASKAGLIGLTKSVAKELASRGITANAIAPGFIETRMTEVLPEEIKKKMRDSIPLGRFGSTTDVAQAALFLASSLSDYVTGQVIVVDGGMVM